LPVDKPEVVEMMRTHVASQFRRRRAVFSSALLLVSFAVSAVICYGLHLKFFDEIGNVANHSSYFVSIALVLFVIASLVSLRWLISPREDEPIIEIIARLKPVVTPK
jgi:hypothetical protein